MSAVLHQEALRLASQANLLEGPERDGQVIRLRRQAALYEERYFRLVAPEHQQVRGIIATNAVALYWRIGDYVKARDLVTEYLLMGRLSAESNAELLAIVQQKES